MVLDRDLGPLLLELNARPGLAIQIANRFGLSARPEAIGSQRKEIGLTPGQMAGWAMKYFGEQ